MPERQDMAEHWAEESGGRLLTEYEFAYLAARAAKAEAENGDDFIDAGLFDVAGGSLRDAIPTNPPIRGILSGFAEWTSSIPDETDSLPAVQEFLPIDYRIIRGGSTETAANSRRRDPKLRSMAPYFEFHPHVGFRIARTAPTQEDRHD